MLLALVTKPTWLEPDEAEGRPKVFLSQVGGLAGSGAAVVFGAPAHVLLEVTCVTEKRMSQVGHLGLWKDEPTDDGNGLRVVQLFKVTYKSIFYV